VKIGSIPGLSPAGVHILLLGDSFIRCWHGTCGLGGGPVTSSNRWGEQLRIKMQAIYGIGGPGLVTLVYSASSTPAIDSELWSCTGTFTTAVGSLGPTQSNGNAMVHMSPGAVCTYNDARAIPFTNFGVLYATASTNSTLTLVADGTTALGAPSSANATSTGAAAGGLTSHWFAGTATMASAVHTITASCTGTDFCNLYGGYAQNGTTGVTVDTAAIGGAQAGMFGAAPSTQLAFTDLLPGGSQAVIIMDQTNDAAAGIATATFSTNMQNIITHEQASAYEPTVMLAIPPVDVVNGTDPMAPYTAVQTGLCSTDSLTCVNIQNRYTLVGSQPSGWGTTYNSASGLWDLTGTAWPSGSAGVHPNDNGTLDEFQMIYAQLVNPVASGSTTTLTTNFNFPTTKATLTGGTINIPPSSAAYDYLELNNTAGAASTTENSVFYYANAAGQVVTLPSAASSLDSSTGCNAGVLACGPTRAITVFNSSTGNVTVIAPSPWALDPTALDPQCVSGTCTIPAGGSITFGTFNLGSGTQNWFVISTSNPRIQAGTATPLIDGTAAVGTSLLYARQDHVHPTDTTRAAATALPLSGTTGSIGGAIAIGSCDTGTATITGATTSMVAIADATTSGAPGFSATGAFQVSAQVTSANTVTVSVCALLGASPIPTSSTYLVRVVQ
jgi:hypothetical protein